METDKKIRYALVGYGTTGKKHLAALERRDDFECAGVWDNDPERMEEAKAAGLPAYASFEEIKDDGRAELVIVTSWNDGRKPISVELIKAGKNVITETPAALTAEDFALTVAAAEEKGVFFREHVPGLTYGDYLTVRKLIEENTLGKVFRIEMRRQSSRGIRGDWRKEASHGGGVIFDRGADMIEAALSLAENDPLLSVRAKTTYITNVECEDGFYCEMVFRSGLTISVEDTTNNFIALPRWYVLGVNGTAVIDDRTERAEAALVVDWDKIDAVPVKAGTGITMTMAPRTDETVKNVKLERVPNAKDAFYDSVAGALRGENKTDNGHKLTTRALAVTEAIFRSAESGMTEKFEDKYL